MPPTADLSRWLTKAEAAGTIVFEMRMPRHQGLLLT